MREAAARLAAAGVENALRDVRLLLAHALGIEPVDVIVRDGDAVDAAGLTAFEDAVKRREAGEPVSRIRGWRDFFGRRFIVTPGVLDPRPETELLVEEGLKRLPQGGRVLDLGTGSGCILLSILAERPDARGVGVDISAGALKTAAANAGALGLTGRAAFVEGGWAAGGEGFDLIVSNPPYIREDDLPGLAVEVRAHDPVLALTGGADGLEPYRIIPAEARERLRPGGWLGMEFGQGQERDVASLMQGQGFAEVTLFTDLAGIIRTAFGRKAG